MKTKLTILIIFLMMSIWSYGQVTRPPVKTNELELIDKFTWQNDVIGKDSLVYFIQIDQNCYKYRSLETASVWDTICFSSDSVYFTPLDIWIINGGTITINDSVFHVRHNPDCSICWQYSYDQIEWKELFCNNVATGRFLIGNTADSIFYMNYFGYFDNWTDNFQFHINKADSNKVLTMRSDSTVGWELPDIDSLFNVDSDEWLLPGDTIPDQRDSLFFENIGWKANRDTVPDKTDSLFLYDGRYYDRGDELIINNNIDTIYSTLTVTDTVYSQIARIDTVYSQISRVDTIYSTIIKTDTIVLNGEGFADEKVKIAYYAGGKSTAGYLNENDFTLQNVGGVNRFRLKDTCLWTPDTYGAYYLDDIGIGANSERYVTLSISDQYTESNISGVSFAISAGSTKAGGTGIVGYASESGGTGISGVGNNANGWGFYGTGKYGVQGVSYGTGGAGIKGGVNSGVASYSGEFSGGLGLKADSLSLTSGSKIGRLGTMATFDIWTGTQAQYDAIGSPSSTTLYFIKD